MKRQEIVEDPEADLLKEATGGDIEALGMLLERYLPTVRATIRSCGARGDSVDDIAQDVMCEAIQSFHTYRAERSSFGTWLGALTRYTVKRSFKKAKVRDRLAPMVQCADPEDVPRSNDPNLWDPCYEDSGRRMKTDA